jgi:hypothetical protein
MAKIKTKKPTHPLHPKRILHPFRLLWKLITAPIARHWQRARFWQRILVSIGLVLLLMLSSMYGIAQWYIHKHAKEPLVWGVTFIPSYARLFELDPKETMQAMLDDLGVRRFRLVSYWDVSEKERDHYDFSELDWQFEKAEAANATISLAIGLRQPRWPECHMPAWAMPLPKDEWYPELKEYMTAVIERYKSSPALESYQLENEFFLTVFGECPDFSRDRLIDEFNLVKELDPNHKVIVARSNNAIGFPIGEPVPDEYGVSVYKRVWDKTITKRYFEYPFPAWFYAFLAGGGELLHGKDMIVHELQAEPWPPNGIMNATVAEQMKSMNAERMRDRLAYGKGTGMKTIDLWGAEWWYWLKVKKNDPSIWNVVKEEVQKADINAPDRYQSRY